MGETRNVYRILGSDTEGKRLIGRPRYRREEKCHDTYWIGS
jgi:hypothetical protein